MTTDKLEAIAHAARQHFTATAFYDGVLWKLHLQKLLGIGIPHHIADHERQWCKHKADAEALRNATRTPWPPGMAAPSAAAAPAPAPAAAPSRPAPAAPQAKPTQGGFLL